MCWVVRKSEKRYTIVSFLTLFFIFTAIFFALFNYGNLGMTSEETLEAIFTSAFIAGLLATCCTCANSEFVAPKEHTGGVNLEHFFI